MPDPAAPPLDLDAIDPSYYYVHLFNAAAEQPNIVGALVARVRALEAEVARLQAVVQCSIWPCREPVVASDPDGVLFCAQHAGSDSTPF